MRLSARSWAATGVAVGVVVGGGVAVAAATRSSNVIHACYARHGGALRIAGKCHRGEAALSWNRIGPRGLTGATGQNGLNGQNGQNGKNGLNGTNGLPGTARAYAYVNGSVATPSFSTARTKGFSAVSEPTPGTYCLNAPGIDPTKTAAVVGSVYASGFAGAPTDVVLDAHNNGCPAGQFDVITRQTTVGSGPTITAAAAANIDFTIIVP